MLIEAEHVRDLLETMHAEIEREHKTLKPQWLSRQNVRRGAALVARGQALVDFGSRLLEIERAAKAQK